MNDPSPPINFRDMTDAERNNAFAAEIKRRCATEGMMPAASPPDPAPATELPKGVTFRNGRYRARIKRNGVWHTRPPRVNAKDAISDLRELNALYPHIRKVRPGAREINRAHKEQLATLPRYTKLTGIYRGPSGYIVKLTRRRGEVLYGGHYKLLLPAVQRRDELELLHPLSK